MSKVIFFDIDGTLIDQANGVDTISDKILYQLKRLHALGYILIVASGRPYTFITEGIKVYPFDGYVLCNGAHVEYQGEMLLHEVIEKKDRKALVKELKEIGCEYIIQTKRESYLHPTFTNLHNFYLQSDINIELLHFSFNEKEVLPHVLKFEVYATEEQKVKVEAYIQLKFNYDTHGTVNSFEIYSKEVTKAVGAKKIIDYLDIPIENVYAFGDGTNDIELLEYVGHSVAMGNAEESVKAVADEVCEPVWNDGLAKALAKLV